MEKKPTETQTALNRLRKTIETTWESRMMRLRDVQTCDALTHLDNQASRTNPQLGGVRVNMVRGFVDMSVGALAAQNVKIRVTPRALPGRDPFANRVAEYRTFQISTMLEAADFHDALYSCCQDAVMSGEGAVELGLVKDGDSILPYSDAIGWQEFYPDPASRRDDLRDASFCFIIRKLDYWSAVTMFPAHKEKLDGWKQNFSLGRHPDDADQFDGYNSSFWREHSYYGPFQTSGHEMQVIIAKYWFMDEDGYPALRHFIADPSLSCLTPIAGAKEKEKLKQYRMERFPIVRVRAGTYNSDTQPFGPSVRFRTETENYINHFIQTIASLGSKRSGRMSMSAIPKDADGNDLYDYKTWAGIVNNWSSDPDRGILLLQDKDAIDLDENSKIIAAMSGVVEFLMKVHMMSGHVPAKELMGMAGGATAAVALQEKSRQYRMLASRVFRSRRGAVKTAGEICLSFLEQFGAQMTFGSRLRDDGNVEDHDDEEIASMVQDGDARINQTRYELRVRAGDSAEPMSDTTKTMFGEGIKLLGSNPDDALNMILAVLLEEKPSMADMMIDSMLAGGRVLPENLLHNPQRRALNQQNRQARDQQKQMVMTSEMDAKQKDAAKKSAEAQLALARIQEAMAKAAEIRNRIEMGTPGAPGDGTDDIAAVQAENDTLRRELGLLTDSLAQAASPGGGAGGGGGMPPESTPGFSGGAVNSV